MSRGWERLEEKERSEGGRKSCEVWVFFLVEGVKADRE